jgi:outer membrane protein TolC
VGQEVGDRTTLDRLNAEADASAADLMLAQARAALLQDRVRLAAAAGRLSDDLMRSIDAEMRGGAAR